MNCPSVHLIPMVDVIMELLREQNTSNSTAFCGDRKVDITATKYKILVNYGLVAV